MRVGHFKDFQMSGVGIGVVAKVLVKVEEKMMALGNTATWKTKRPRQPIH